MVIFLKFLMKLYNDCNLHQKGNVEVEIRLFSLTLLTNLLPSDFVIFHTFFFNFLYISTSNKKPTVHIMYISMIRRQAKYYPPLRSWRETTQPPVLVSYSPQCQWKWWIFTSPLCGLININHYSPPLQWIINSLQCINIFKKIHKLIIVWFQKISTEGPKIPIYLHTFLLTLLLLPTPFPLEFPLPFCAGGTVYGY